MRRFTGSLVLLLLLWPLVAQATLKSGSITVNGQCVTSQIEPVSNVTIDVGGTWTGTLTFSTLVDPTIGWVTTAVFPVAGGNGVTTTTVNGRWALGVALSSLRVCATAAVTGTALIAVLTSFSTLTLPPTAAAGAPSDASYVTLGANASLSAYRVLTGTANQVTVTDAGAATTVTLSLPTTVNLGVASTTAGKVLLYGSTSGSTTVQATAAAGTTTLTFPAATDTLVGKATTDTFTNKTYDTAGSGNVFSINGTAISAVSGSGAVALVNTPTLITPVLGVATGTSVALSSYAMLGSTTPLTLTAGALGMSKITASGTAPGAAGAKFEVVCGTNAGTAKLIMAAGTSATAVTVIDNVGAGVTGC